MLNSHSLGGGTSVRLGGYRDHSHVHDRYHSREYRLSERAGALMHPAFARAWSGIKKAAHRVTTPSPRWRRWGKRWRVGYRGAFLLMFGLTFIALGLNIVFSVGAPDRYLFHTRLPEVARVSLWAGCGLIAVIASRSPRWQWTGFAALVLPPVERFLSYAIAVVADLVTIGPGPVPWPYLNGLVLYLTIIGVTRLASAWPEPPDTDIS